MATHVGVYRNRAGRLVYVPCITTCTAPDAAVALLCMQELADGVQSLPEGLVSPETRRGLLAWEAGGRQVMTADQYAEQALAADDVTGLRQVQAMLLGSPALHRQVGARLYRAAGPASTSLRRDRSRRGVSC